MNPTTLIKILVKKKGSGFQWLDTDKFHKILEAILNAMGAFPDELLAEIEEHVEVVDEDAKKEEVGAAADDANATPGATPGATPNDAVELEPKKTVLKTFQRFVCIDKLVAMLRESVLASLPINESLLRSALRSFCDPPNDRNLVLRPEKILNVCARLAYNKSTTGHNSMPRDEFFAQWEKCIPSYYLGDLSSAGLGDVDNADLNDFNLDGNSNMGNLNTDVPMCDTTDTLQFNSIKGNIEHVSVLSDEHLKPPFYVLPAPAPDSGAHNSVSNNTSSSNLNLNNNLNSYNNHSSLNSNSESKTSKIVVKAEESELPQHCGRARLRRLFELSPMWPRDFILPLVASVLNEKADNWLLKHARAIVLEGSDEAVIVPKFGLTQAARQHLGPDARRQPQLNLV